MHICLFKILTEHTIMIYINGRIYLHSFRRHNIEAITRYKL